MDQCLDSIGEAGKFPTIDANYGYLQIRISDRDKNKTTFISYHELYKFLRMRFRLKSAPCAFQRAMDIIQSAVKWQFQLVCLAVVVIFSMSVEELLDHLWPAVRLLWREYVSMKLKKSLFSEHCIDYVRHLVQPGTIGISIKATDTILRLQNSTNVAECILFLDLCNVFNQLFRVLDV